MTTVIVDLSRELAAHLAVALAKHRREAHRSGLRLPLQLDDVAELFSSVAIAGQDRTPLDQLLDSAHIEPIPRQLLTLTEVAAALACSERTVRRLIATGTLTAVRVGQGSTRVKTTDLTTYVQHLNGDCHADE